MQFKVKDGKRRSRNGIQTKENKQLIVGQLFSSSRLRFHSMAQEAL
jgi:hypothetical protein